MLISHDVRLPVERLQDIPRLTRNAADIMQYILLSWQDKDLDRVEPGPDKKSFNNKAFDPEKNSLVHNFSKETNVVGGKQPATRFEKNSNNQSIPDQNIKAQPSATPKKAWGMNNENEYSSAQHTTEEQIKQTKIYMGSGVSANEIISANDFNVIRNHPRSAQTGYSDCLLFSLAQHTLGIYDSDSSLVRHAVAKWRKNLVDNGWASLDVKGGFGANGYVYSNSKATKFLIDNINKFTKNMGVPPFKVIFHEFSKIGENQYAEFIDGYGPDNGKVVHIRNMNQHYEALI